MMKLYSFSHFECSIFYEAFFSFQSINLSKNNYSSDSSDILAIKGMKQLICIRYQTKKTRARLEKQSNYHHQLWNVLKFNSAAAKCRIRSLDRQRGQIPDRHGCFFLMKESCQIKSLFFYCA